MYIRHYDIRMFLHTADKYGPLIFIEMPVMLIVNYHSDINNLAKGKMAQTNRHNVVLQ